VGGVTILDDPSFSAGPFASLTSLDVGVKLLPLLSRQVEVEEISLRDPVITVITNKDGVMNVSTIGARTATPSRRNSTQTTADRQTECEMDEVTYKWSQFRCPLCGELVGCEGEECRVELLREHVAECRKGKTDWKVRYSE
jgi:predicted RNA-binding Zn-ribbon protein involved in translation (DUF1610 family)